MNNPRCAAYLRVSTEHQSRKLTPIPSQLSEIRVWAKGNNATILETWVIADKGISGSTDNRPGFQRLIKAARSETCPFDIILVYDRDRFFRNFEEAIYYEVVLRKHNIQLISITENEDPPLVRYIKGIVAEETRKQVIKHTLRGMKERTRRGLLNGGATPYGYKRIILNIDGKEQATLIPGDTQEVETVRNIFKWYLEGEGYYAIVNRLNKAGVPSPATSKIHGGCPTAKFGWAKSTARNILSNRVYIGTLIWNKRRAKQDKGKLNPETEWIVKENAFEPIIDKSIFKKVQMTLRQRRKTNKIKNTGGRKPNGAYLLSNVMFCGKCSHHYTGFRSEISKKNKYYRRYYVCAGHRTKGEYFCDWSPVDADWIESKLFVRIHETLIASEWTDRMVEELNKKYQWEKNNLSHRLRTINQEIHKVGKELTRLVQLVKTTERVPSAIVEEIANLEDKQQELIYNRDLLLQMSRKENKVEKQQVLEMLSDIEEIIKEKVSSEGKHRFVADYIPRLDVYPSEKIVAQLNLPLPQMSFVTGYGGGGI